MQVIFAGGVLLFIALALFSSTVPEFLSYGVSLSPDLHMLVSKISFNRVKSSQRGTIIYIHLLDTMFACLQSIWLILSLLNNYLCTTIVLLKKRLALHGVRKVPLGKCKREIVAALKM